MNIDVNGVKFISAHEGFVDHAYKPVAAEKYFTIGFGHYGADVRQDQKISRAEAEALLLKDLKGYVDAVNKLVAVLINQNQANALYSFAYNCGVQALADSTLLRKLNAKDFVGASQEFGKWVHDASKGVSPGLIQRRKEEADLFMKPVAPVVSKPKPPQPVYYVVVKGDTLSEIAAAKNTTVVSLCKLNGIDVKSVLQLGQKVRIK